MEIIKLKTKKAEITMQTIFFIMMSILMIAIMIFGINKIFLVKDQLSEQDRIQIQKEIERAINYCDDPLNKGNKKIFEFENKLFNGICIINNQINEEPKYEYLSNIYLNGDGDNIALVKTIFEYNNEEPVKKEIISSFKIDKILGTTHCWYDKENTGKIEIDIKCK